MIKLTLSLLLLAAAYGQSQTKLTIVVTDDNGLVTRAQISGDKAKYGLETFRLWLATQTICTPATPEAPSVCSPKYENEAEGLKSVIIGVLKNLAPKFPSSATKPIEDDIAAKQKLLEEKREKMFDDAKKEKPQ